MRRKLLGVLCLVPFVSLVLAVFGWKPVLVVGLIVSVGAFALIGLRLLLTDR